MTGRMSRVGIVTAVLAGAACTPTPAPQSAATPDPGQTFPSSAPTPGTVKSLTLPAPERRMLSNGLEVIYVPHGSLPVVHATLLTRGGLSDDPADLPGLAAFTASMIDEGADGRDALELAEALDALGARLSTNAGWDAAYIDLHVLRDRLPGALEIMADVAARPDFPASEFQRLQQELLTDLARARDEARVIAGNAFSSLVYGDAHPYGRSASTESVDRFGIDRLRQFHQQYYRPGAATLVLTGDVDPDALHPMIERAFGNWNAGTPPAEPAIAAAADPRSTTIFLIDKPGAAQSEIRIGHPGVARSHPDFFPLTVLNTILGGSFTSRLNSNLRETHGYTYGARSSYEMRHGPGPFLASAAVVTAKTDSSVIEFFKELDRIRAERVSEDELERAKNFVALGLPRRFETSAGVAAQIADLELYGLTIDFYNDYVEKVMDITADDITRVAREHVRPGRSVVVVVGDRATIESGLRALDVGPVVVREVDEFVR